MEGLDRGRHAPEIVLSPHLAPAERLLWSGRPPRGILFRTSEIVTIPFSLLWGGFMMFWVFSAVREGAPWGVVLVGVTFALVGLYMILGRFLVDARQREQTLYGVTNERVIIVSGLWTRKVKSLDLRTLTDVTLSERADGTGTITFGASSASAWWFQGMYWPAMPALPACFELIPGAKRVYDLIRQAQRSS